LKLDYFREKKFPKLKYVVIRYQIITNYTVLSTGAILSIKIHTFFYKNYINRAEPHVSNFSSIWIWSKFSLFLDR